MAFGSLAFSPRGLVFVTALTALAATVAHAEPRTLGPTTYTAPDARTLQPPNFPAEAQEASSKAARQRVGIVHAAADDRHRPRAAFDRFSTCCTHRP